MREGQRPAAIPWLAILLLLFAPTLASLLQLALARIREGRGGWLSGDQEQVRRAPRHSIRGFWS